MGSAGRLFCFGFGYSAEALARRLKTEGWTIAGTCRDDTRKAEMAALGVEAHPFDSALPLSDAAKVLASFTHILISVPPDSGADQGLDPVLRHHRDHLLGAVKSLRWIGYLSSTGVYGDAQGRPVDESWPSRPTSARSQRRLETENAWLALSRRPSLLPVHVFRLAGIYGPGRSALDDVRKGTAKRIDRPRHRFSRIHVDDIANVLAASMARPHAGAVYNVSDDEPAPPAMVTEEACRLLKADLPPLQSFTEASRTMSQMALGFWRDDRYMLNVRIKHELGVKLLYPDYRAGLKAILKAKG
ncbi:MAG: SDR family oxidoreductase [Alphaproteobacteria bacterium]|nr:SDR family oxidoreductase [Alphaproteobacteria bacterium]